MKRLAVGLVFVVLFALGLIGQSAVVQWQDAAQADTLAVNWNSRIKK